MAGCTPEYQDEMSRVFESIHEEMTGYTDGMGKHDAGGRYRRIHVWSGEANDRRRGGPFVLSS
jgi:hypothetical protein